MNSLILRIAARYLTPLLMLFSLFILYRGHNAPGGGFIGGLLAAAALALYAIANNAESASRKLRINPRSLIATGLLIALLSGLFSIFLGDPFLTGQWIFPELPIVGQLPLGTPLLFDIGVYLVVIGVMLLIVFELARSSNFEKEEN
jgi:multicomponent Na+:H+ antiporter subunit B